MSRCLCKLTLGTVAALLLLGMNAPAAQVPFEQVMPRFQSAAEDAIEREQIPPAYRDHVRRYYEDLHRK